MPSRNGSKPQANSWRPGLMLPLLGAALAVMVTACAGYRLGPVGGQTAGARSIRVVPFPNDTLEPRLTDAVTTALHKEFQRDATFHLSTHGDSDIVVSGRLTRYLRDVQSLAPNDLATARDYRLELTAQVTARERATGRLLMDQPMTGSTLIRVGSDLVSTERQALPLLATDLAKRIVAHLTEGGW